MNCPVLEVGVFVCMGLKRVRPWSFDTEQCRNVDTGWWFNEPPLFKSVTNSRRWSHNAPCNFAFSTSITPVRHGYLGTVIWFVPTGFQCTSSDLGPEVMSEIHGSFRHWAEFKETLTAVARAFGTFHRLDRFRDVCIMRNPNVPEDWVRLQSFFKVFDLFTMTGPTTATGTETRITETSKKVIGVNFHLVLLLRVSMLQEFRHALVGLFKTVCPQFVEHRWEYLFETLEWVAPRKSALEFLKLRDFTNAAAERENPSQNEQHHLSSKHLELLTSLCDDGVAARRFWAMCGLCKILSDWGHGVTGFLHGCPCHDWKERPKKRMKKDVEFLEKKEEADRQTNCPMSGRMAVPLAAGYPKSALQKLKSEASNFPNHVQTAVQRLFEKDPDSANILLDNFRVAVSKLEFRMTQAFGYWNELPWVLLMIMQPYVLNFSTAEEAWTQAWHRSRRIAFDL